MELIMSILVGMVAIWATITIITVIQEVRLATKLEDERAFVKDKILLHIDGIRVAEIKSIHGDINRYRRVQIYYIVEYKAWTNAIVSKLVSKSEIGNDKTWKYGKRKQNDNQNVVLLKEWLLEHRGVE